MLPFLARCRTLSNVYFSTSLKTKPDFYKWICFPSIADDPRARGDSALRRGLPPPQTELPPEEDQEDQDSGKDDICWVNQKISLSTLEQNDHLVQA